MHRFKVLIQIALVVCLMAAMLKSSARGTDNVSAANNFGKKDRLVIWYSDDLLTEYMQQLSVSYYEETGVRISPVKKDGIEYIKQIQEASLEEAPDLFILGSNSLEEIYERDMVNNDITLDTGYVENAVRCVTCRDNILAYPFDYDCAFLVGNTDYLKNYAADQIMAKKAQDAADEAAQEGLDVSANIAAQNTEASAEEIEELSKSYIPSNFSELESFAELYDAPENVTAILGWDNSDVFYNYFILGDRIDIGGPNGDDENSFNIVNTDSISCLKRYKEVQEYFSLDENLSYEKVREGFVSGNYVFAVASSDIVKSVNDSFEYSISALPTVIDDMSPCAMSVTNCICIDKRSKMSDEAKRLSEYMTEASGAQMLYETTGRFLPREDCCMVNERAYDILKQYNQSAVSVKLRSRNDYWMELEIALQKAALGEESPENILRQLENSLK